MSSAYALTVHKTQGSESGITLLVLPNPCWLLSRELLYSELPLGADELSAEDVAVDVEIPPGEWTPLIPSPLAPPRLVFVDRVRRIEARLVVRRGDRVAHGAFGSFAVGSVLAGAGGAAVSGEVRMQRQRSGLCWRADTFSRGPRRHAESD